MGFHWIACHLLIGFCVSPQLWSSLPWLLRCTFSNGSFCMELMQVTAYYLCALLLTFILIYLDRIGFCALVRVLSLWARSCIWIGMTTMEENLLPLTSFRSYLPFKICLCLSFTVFLLLLWVVDFEFNLIYLQLWKRFRGNDKPPAHLGSSRDYNVDMIPKVYFPPCFFFVLFDQLFNFLSWSFFKSLFIRRRFSLWLVYDGKWQSCTCPHSHKCYQISVLQSSGWQLCPQQGKGMLSRGWLFTLLSVMIYFLLKAIGINYCNRFTRCLQLTWRHSNLLWWVFLKSAVLGSFSYMSITMKKVILKHTREWTWREWLPENWLRMPPLQAYMSHVSLYACFSSTTL
jgi:hypothetical protein